MPQRMPMKNPRILILGGYGNTGRALAPLLLQETDVNLVLAGRNALKAESAAAELNTLFDGQRVSSVYADASKPDSLKAALENIDMLLVVSSTSQFSGQVAAAALEAGADYYDVQYSTYKIEVLKSLAKEIESAGRCFITEGGFHPGLPAAMIRYAAPQFDRLSSANVGSVIKVNWSNLDASRSTVEELVSEFMDFQNLSYQEGEWKRASMFSWIIPKWMDFGREFGRQYCIPMFLEEMRPIPDLYPDLEETGFFVGGFNWFVDWFVSPLVMVMVRVSPQRGLRMGASLMRWGLDEFSKPPYGTLLKLEARGTQGGEQRSLDVMICHEDGYMITAIPVAACLLQYLDGSIRKPGLWFQALIVEPERFMSDMERMGVEIQVQSHPVIS
jgi:saccharopine dehydrogenase (NAD+, L-lysine-forming)